MRALEYPRSAWVEIGANKTRSGLTCMSLSIGIAAVLFTFAQISWMSREVSRAIELAGPGRMTVRHRDGYTSKGISLGLSYRDALAMREQIPELFMVSPFVRRWGARVNTGGTRIKDVLLWGVTPEWRRRDWVYTVRGRSLSDEDVRHAAKVCVLIQPGGWVQKPYWAKWFPEQQLERLLRHKDILGKQVTIEDRVFTVVGILREPPRDKDPRWFREYTGSGGGTVVIPITTYQRYLLPSWRRNHPDYVDQIDVDAGGEAATGPMMRRIQALLESRHREKDFEVIDNREQFQGAMKSNRENALAVLIIGIVAIAAGGIGIMNVTLATTFSRVREIGIRRALGATRADVVVQFVTEAMMLGLLGGLAGLPLGLAAVKYLSPEADRVLLPGVAQMSAALLLAIGTGLFFSFYPAWQAAKFDPLEALRYE
ncbi:MAG: ABC transporter permease [Elusimicrobia bacterium]|nr:ABC transporter permease [Elusimicrobiota bacterium]